MTASTTSNNTTARSALVSGTDQDRQTHGGGNVIQRKTAYKSTLRFEEKKSANCKQLALRDKKRMPGIQSAGHFFHVAISCRRPSSRSGKRH